MQYITVFDVHAFIDKVIQHLKAAPRESLMLLAAACGAFFLAFVIIIVLIIRGIKRRKNEKAHRIEEKSAEITDAVRHQQTSAEAENHSGAEEPFGAKEPSGTKNSSGIKNRKSARAEGNPGAKAEEKGTPQGLKKGRMQGSHAEETPEAEPAKAETEMLYVYTSPHDIRICLYCGGENKVNAEYCRCCGEKL
ncbi:MAG: hypothetical protein IJ123_07930 [Blautia sp.]|nr:hypothetical protein [Blautia sp.]